MGNTSALLWDKYVQRCIELTPEPYFEFPAPAGTADDKELLGRSARTPVKILTAEGLMTSLNKNARVAGLLYILASAVGVVRLLYIPNALVVHGNAAATASNIATHESLFRLGIVCYLVGGTLWLFVPLALYRLLKGVDQTLAVLMVILGSLMQVPTYLYNTATDVAALLFARGADFLTVFDKPQRDAFALLSLNIHHHLDLANMMFAGLWLIPFGLLVYRSRFLPRLLGAWLMAASLPYVALSIFGFLVPGSEDKIFRWGQPLMLGEVAAMLWLVIMGAKERQAKERQSAATP